MAIGAIALDTALLGLIAPLLPEIERRTDAGEAQLGFALGAYALPILFVSIPLGRLADRLGRRPLLLSGLLLTAIGSITIAASGSLPPLIGGRAIQGIGSAASWIAALALVSDLAPPGRTGESIGYALAANSVGAVSGPALGGLTGEGIGFEFPFLLVAGIAIGLSAAGAAVLPRGVPGSGQGRPRPAGALLRIATSHAVLPATLIVVLGATTLGLIEVVVPLDGDQRLGLSAAAIGALFAMTAGLDAVAAPIAGRAGDRAGRVPISLLGLWVLAASTVVLAAVGGVVGLIAGLALFGIGSSTLFAAAVPWLDDAYGRVDKGFAFGFLNLIFASGYTLGPIAAGAGLELAGPVRVYLVAAALIVLAAAFVSARRGALPD